MADGGAGGIGGAGDGALPFAIFILAPPRSFTTLIGGMLSQHPQIYGIHELTLFYHNSLRALWRHGRTGTPNDSRVRHGILRCVAQLWFGEQTDEAIQGAEHWCARRQNWPSARVFDELRAKVAPFHALEKSPDYAMRLDCMIRCIDACPDARFLYLLRHPITQGVSTLSLNNGAYPRNSNSVAYVDGKAIVDPQIAWHDQNRLIKHFLDRHVPRRHQMILRGEDLTADPEGGVAEICRRFGLRDDAEAIAATTRPEQSPLASFGPITALFGNDPNFLRNPYFSRRKVKPPPPLDTPLPWREDGATLLPEVRALARELGYR